MAHRLWMYGLAHPCTAQIAFLPAASDVRMGDVVRLRSDKLYVGLCLGVTGGTATVRWAWQRNQSTEVSVADLERQRRGAADEG